MQNSKRKNHYKLQVTSYRLRTQSGFTLLEMLLTMAIIAILAGAILVSLSAQRKKANQGKLLAEFSGVVQPMLMCKSDGNTVTSPNGGSGGGNICNGLAAYGKWPNVGGMDFGNYSAANATGMNNGNWWFYVQDGDVQVCCNSASSKCQLQNDGDVCSENTPAQ